MDDYADEMRTAVRHVAVAVQCGADPTGAVFHVGERFGFDLHALLDLIEMVDAK